MLLAGRRTRTVDLFLVRGQCLLLPGAEVTLGAPEERSRVGVLFVLLQRGLVRDLEFAQLAAEGGPWPVLVVLSNMVGEVCCKLKIIIVTNFPRKKNIFSYFSKFKICLHLMAELYEQASHLYGFSLVWTLRCLVRSDFVLKEEEHPSKVQMKGQSPVWVRR